MKVAVVAASGRTGQAFVAEALDEGFKVVAGVHSKNPFTKHPNLEVVHCDATKFDDISGLINGCGAVVSLIGHSRGSSADVQTQTIKNVCQAMDKLGIKRLISLTGTGVRFPGDKLTLADRILNLGVSILDPKRVADGAKHVEIIKKSGLDWTIVRVLKLQNTKPGKYKLTSHGPAKLITSRYDVARAIIKLLRSDGYLKEAPIISKQMKQAPQLEPS